MVRREDAGLQGSLHWMEHQRLASGQSKYQSYSREKNWEKLFKVVKHLKVRKVCGKGSEILFSALVIAELWTVGVIFNLVLWRKWALARRCEKFSPVTEKTQTSSQAFALSLTPSVCV